ncbi:MAG: SPFH domain-containing protein [Planctomycetota bacterium]
MKGEVFHYRRAVTVSLIGLALQFVMTIGLLLLGVYADEASASLQNSTAGAGHAAVSASALSALGMIAWTTLIVLFDMKRRERQEAIEVERMASDAVASAFESGADELNVAARRLASVQKFALPIVSFCLAVSLILTGLVRFSQAKDLTEVGLFETESMRGWSIAAGCSVAFVCFLFARFVAGMAFQKVWAALRGGGTYAVVTMLAAGTIGVAHLIDLLFQQDVLIRLAPAVVAILLIGLGIETAANIVLDLYRPRTAGEEARPAFDSRLLGLLAAPDRIVANVGEALNYQFGVNVSGSWFYDLVRKWWLALVGVAALAIWGMTSLVVVEPHQRALVLNFGRVSAEVGPGLHLKLPYPFGRLYIPEDVVVTQDGEEFRSRTTAGIRVIELGTNPPRDSALAVLWSNDHTLNEIFNFVQPTQRGDETDVETEGADLALVAVQVPMHYVINDVEAFDSFAAPGYREDRIRAIGQRELTLMLGSRSIDEVLAAKNSIVDDLAVRLTEIYEGLGAGIEVIHIGTGIAHPPKKVVPSFERVIQARQSREAILESARATRDSILTTEAGSVDIAQDIVDRIDRLRVAREQGADQTELSRMEVEIEQILENSGGSAGAAIALAAAQRWMRHMGERGRAARYSGQVELYRAAPGLFMSQTYLDAVRESISSSRVFLVGAEHRNLNVVMDLETPETNVQLFDSREPQ